MQLSTFFIIAAVAVVATNAAALSVKERDLLTASMSGLGNLELLGRDVLDARVILASTFDTQALAAASSASPGLKQAQASMKKLDVNTVTLEQLQPIIAQITTAITPASETFSSLATQAKAMKALSKRQGPDLNRAVDQLVVDLNLTLITLVPLVAHLTANLDLGTVQDLVIALSPTLATLILGVEGLLISLAPGLSTIVDPLLVTVYGLTDSLGINLNLPAPSS